jgi:hypothetical protein
MLNYLIRVLLLNGLFCVAFADQQSVYCPQKAGYINIGMTPDQVIGACGMPISQQSSDKPVTQKVPVQQVYYNGQAESTAFYGVWALPGGYANSGAFQPFQANNGGGGVQLEVDIADNVVKAAKLNGSEVNAFSVCNNVSITVGEPAYKVYNACGSPSVVNSTYINVPIKSKQKPQIWVYDMGQYQSAISLTFVNGRLISIQ